MKTGDLVQLFVYSPHSTALGCTPMHTGIFLDYLPSRIMEGTAKRRMSGWLVAVDGKLETFTRTWWKCKLVEGQELEED
jgi:hypothetical protein